MFTPIAYSHDSTREELIARFRDRIAKEERTKLTKPERSELALHFVDRLAQCKTEEDAIALCKAEIALLEEGYPTGSIANQYLPEWRKAIALAVEEGRLAKQELEPNEFGKTYLHWGLKHLLYPNEIHKALKEKTTAANNQKQDDLQPIRANRVITKAKDLLERETPYEWAVGLLVLTGRRFSEIITKGEFKPTAHPYAIAFRGQLKKGIQNLDEAQTFLIATLIESDKVLTAIDKFRAHPRIQALADLSPDEINSRLNTSVRHHIKREFEDAEIVPILRGEKSVSAHNLRGIYAEIALHYFCPQNQATHRFIQAHLGHIIGERELATRKNAGATEHYFHYYLVGAQHQPLNEKGILLERFGALPTTVELEPKAEPELPAIEESQEEPMAIAQETQSHTRKPRAHVPSELMHQLKEIAARKLNADGSYAEVLEAVIEFLQDNKTPAIATSIESLGSTFQWFTQEVERLRQENRRLTSERDQAQAELEGLQNQPQDQGELETLRAENARIKAELSQFQQIKQMLGGVAAGTPEPAAIAGAAIASPSMPQAAPQPRTISATQPKRIKDENQALGKINEAIDLIMAWNDAPGHDFNSKWFISVPAILNLIRGSHYSASQGRVQAAMANRKQEIDSHHEKHGLGQRHNTRHNRDISEDIVL